MSAYMKILISFSLIFYSHAEIKTHKELLDILRESWTSNREHLMEWKIYLNAKEGIKSEDVMNTESLEDYKVPDIAFYTSSNLKGRPYAYINQDGLFIKGTKVCSKGRGLESGLDKVIYFDKFELFDKKTLKGKPCDGLPFNTRTRAEAPVNIVLHLKSINGKIGETFLFSKKVFFDISQFKNKPTIKPTKLRLIEKYGNEFKEIDKVMSSFRNMLLRKDTVALNKYFFEKCFINSPKSLMSRKKEECSEEINNRKFDYYRENKYLEMFFYEALSIDSIGSKDILLRGLNPYTSLYLTKDKNKQWVLYKIDTTHAFSIPELYE